MCKTRVCRVIVKIIPAIEVSISNFTRYSTKITSTITGFRSLEDVNMQANKRLNLIFQLEYIFSLLPPFRLLSSSSASTHPPIWPGAIPFKQSSCIKTQETLRRYITMLRRDVVEQRRILLEHDAESIYSSLKQFKAIFGILVARPWQKQLNLGLEKIVGKGLSRIDSPNNLHQCL